MADLETLVRLYDSLNDQIDKVRSDLHELVYFDYDGQPQHKIDEVEEANELLNKRLNRLMGMREVLEQKLYDILRTGIEANILED